MLNSARRATFSSDIEDREMVYQTTNVQWNPVAFRKPLWEQVKRMEWLLCKSSVDVWWLQRWII